MKSSFLLKEVDKGKVGMSREKSGRKAPKDQLVSRLNVGAMCRHSSRLLAAEDTCHREVSAPQASTPPGPSGRNTGERSVHVERVHVSRSGQGALRARGESARVQVWSESAPCTWRECTCPGLVSQTQTNVPHH
ncbi:unnamed protein product [Pleuronectes platessa]|uniref:Uncharacterized protein n=1 Tax=Pleuronectes platessa TaxID=8262 RepID=A0A9N7UZY1_PLEPL|nr:unnamed protein product [Pleuronectes platessa]